MTARLQSGPAVAGVGAPTSALALGAMGFSLVGSEEHHALLDAFVDVGGTVIDTARIYGESEAVVGDWLRGRSDRDRIVLITKCAHGEDHAVPDDDLPGVLRGELAESLEKLATDHIDVYLLHRDNHVMPVGDILEPMNAVVESGAVRAIGASNWEYRRVVEAQEYADKHGLVGFSMISNTLTLALPRASFWPGTVTVDPYGEAWHRETGVPLLPWSALGRGFYSGQYSQSGRDDPSVSDFERVVYRVYGSDENFERLARAEALGEKKGCPAVEVALAWVLNRAFPIIPLVGPQSVEELQSCVRAAELSLTAEELAWLNLEQDDA